MIQLHIEIYQKQFQLDLNITDNQFITKDTYYTPQDDDEDTSNKSHYIDFEIPIFLKDISEFFKKNHCSKIW